MSRDPLREPRFGDVFRWNSSTTVLYIRPTSRLMGDDWMGLALNLEFGFDGAVQSWQPLNNSRWSFVETIAVHATGGAMSFGGMTVRAAMARLAAEPS